VCIEGKDMYNTEINTNVSWWMLKFKPHANSTIFARMPVHELRLLSSR